MSKLKSFVALVILILATLLCQAQTGDDKAEMADLMRSNGRIYVVVAVVVLILIGLILYIVRLDRKISKMEKEK
ncbi:MAG TPA: hypothetical protein VK588_14355 [Chitinophagaceae bacterium]|nr:hypothetical protein [Chitinophagaceae bacterium]